jgi:hypothetical protein
MSGVALATLCMTSSTAAALQWLLDGKPLTSKVAVNSSTELLVGDLDATGGPMAFTCEGTSRGTVGPTDHDEVTEFEFTECKFEPGQRGGCETEDITGRWFGLPLSSLLSTTLGATSDRLLSEGGKPFGFVWECQLRFEDECAFSEADLNVVNLASGVDANFLEATGGNCTLGTRSSGMLIGTDLIENPKGHKLSVSMPPVPCSVKLTKWVFCSGGDETTGQAAQAVEGTTGATTIKSTAGGLELEVTCKKGKYAPTLEFGGAMSGPLTLEECTIPKPSGTCKFKGEKIATEPIPGILEGPLTGSPEVKLEGAGTRGKFQIEGCTAIEGTYTLTGTQKCTVGTNFKKEEAEHEFKCAEAGSSLKLEKEGSGKNEAAKLSMTVKGPLSGGGKWSMELN